MSDLKQCPFCGGEARTHYVKGYELWEVSCGQCGVELSSYMSEADAINAWNRRAEPAERTAKVTNWQTDPLRISRCKNCGEPSEKMNGDRFTYCPKCGCKLDWSE